MARSLTTRPFVSFRLYAPLVDSLRARGLDVDALLERADISTEVLSDSDTRISQASLDAFWDIALEATGDPDLPLRLGISVEPSALGLVGYLVGTAESGLDAVERVSSIRRYFADDADVSVVFERGLAVLCFGKRPSHELSRSASTYGVALTIGMSRHLGRLVDTGPAVEARFRKPVPPDAERVEAILGVPVRFGTSHDGASFRLTAFRAPNPKADPLLRGLLEQHAADLLARIPVADSFADRVRNCVVELLPTGRPSVEETARGLRMSARTLRRRLAEENTNFRDVLDDVRQTVALQQLGPEGLSVEEVAYRLGFSDASGFHKAFRRWLGESPADYLHKRAKG